MRRLKTKYPIWTGILLTILFPAVSLLATLPFSGTIFENGEYLIQLIVELITLAVMTAVTLLLRMSYVFRPGRRGFLKCLVPALPIILVYTYSLLGTIILYCSGQELQTPLRIAAFVLCMLAIGVTEELTFRGLITRMIFEKYGRNSVGVWLSVLVSSLLFGAVHMVNSFSGTVAIGGVLIQMVGAASLGMCLAAIYLRTRSLWAVALLHAYIDFCALFSSGVFSVGSVADSVSSYSLVTLLGSAVYVALALFLLRKSQMKRITDIKAEPQAGEVIKLMITVMLLTGLASAVLVLSI